VTRAEIINLITELAMGERGESLTPYSVGRRAILTMGQIRVE
jgi:hypothetical protein